MTYQQFFERVCEHVKGLGLVVRTESFVMPNCPRDTAVFISSQAHEVPVAYVAKNDAPMLVMDAEMMARIDGALDMLANIVSGVARLNAQQTAAYYRLERAMGRAKPKERPVLNA